MTTAEQFIAIVLAAFLALFILLSIILVIQVLKVVSAVKSVVVKADSIVTSAESLTDVFENVGGPLAMFRLVSNIVKMVNKAKKGRR